ncbi:MAG: Cys-tRNA(Pro)/Cys-tRNA(Cys) deacylase YbaK [Chloroflexota bacterium]
MASTPAGLELERLGLPYEEIRYQIEPLSGPELHRGQQIAYARAAAQALGADPEQIYKTLVVALEGAPDAEPALALAVVASNAELSEKRVAAELGAKRARLADVATAERATGYVVGGISPLGTRRRLPVLLDATALRQEHIYVSAGARGRSVGLAPTTLLQATGGTVGDIAVPISERKI